MGLTSIFSGNRTIIAFIAVGLLGAGLIADLIVTALWWSDYHPFGPYFSDSVFTIYYSTLLCWIFSLIAIVVLILTVVFGFIPVGDNDVISAILVALLFVFSLISISAGIVSSGIGLYNFKVTKHYAYINDEGAFVQETKDVNFKCHKDFIYQIGRGSEIIYTYNDILEDKDAKDYGKWASKLVRKIHNDIPDEAKDILEAGFEATIIIDANPYKPSAAEKYIEIIEDGTCDEGNMDCALPIIKNEYGMDKLSDQEIKDFLTKARAYREISELWLEFFEVPGNEGRGPAEYDDISDKLCLTLALPTLIFAIIQIAGLVLFAISACLCGGGTSLVSGSGY